MWPFASRVERELEELYTSVLTSTAGMSEREARASVREGLKQSKEDGAKEGTANLSERFGEALLVGVERRDETALKIVRKARAEGATDADIIEWWNLPDLCRRMTLWSEQFFRYSTFLKCTQDQGLSADEAMARVRKMFPMYGDPTNTAHVSGEDRLLPHELRGRVDVFRERHGGEKILRAVERKYSTYNAFIRARLREGKL